MRIFFGFIVYLFLSIQLNAQELRQHIIDEGFLIEGFDQAEVLNLTSIKRVSSFQELFWKKDSLIQDFRFVIPYNFEKKKIDKSSRYGIPVEGLPSACLIYDCRKSWVTIILKSKKDYDLIFDEGGLETTIEKNILNYGYLPYFSDSPDVAYTEIKIPNQLKIQKAEYILLRIMDIYLNLIERKTQEENIEVTEALEKYPLKIMLTKWIKPPKREIEDTEEIDQNIEIDLGN